MLTPLYSALHFATCGDTAGSHAGRFSGVRSFAPALTFSFRVVLLSLVLDNGDVVAKGSSNLAISRVLIASKSRHIPVTGVNHFHDLHWMIVKSRRPIIYNLCTIRKLVFKRTSSGKLKHLSKGGIDIFAFLEAVDAEVHGDGQD